PAEFGCRPRSPERLPVGRGTRERRRDRRVRPRVHLCGRAVGRGERVGCLRSGGGPARRVVLSRVVRRRVQSSSAAHGAAADARRPPRRPRDGHDSGGTDRAAGISSVLGRILVDWRTPVGGRYSYLSATSGSTLAARRAGRYDASIATAAKATATVVNVAGSSGCKPNRSDSRYRVSPAAPAIPIAMPARVSTRLLPRTSRMTSRLAAPSATRTPISRVRWATE